MRSSLLTTLVTGEQSFFLTASGPFVLAEFPQQLPCACTCELSFSLLCRITNIAGQLVRNECNILSLGGIKASEVPNLQEQLRLLFSLVVEHGHRVALIDLQAIPHVTLARWGT